MNFLSRFRFTAILPLLACAACTADSIRFDPEGDPNATSTASLSTSQIVFDMSAQSYDDAVRVYASPRNGAVGSPLPLGDADRLEATLGGVVRTMVLDGAHYVATFPASTSDADAVIHFSRGAAHAGSFTSTGRLAAPFTIVSTPSKITDGDVVHFKLSSLPPRDAQTTLRFGAAPDGSANAKCIEWPHDKTFPVTVADDGVVTFEASRVFARNPNQRLAPDCDVVIGVRFETTGATDPALGKGSALVGLREHPFVAHLVRVTGS